MQARDATAGTPIDLTSGQPGSSPLTPMQAYNKALCRACPRVRIEVSVGPSAQSHWTKKFLHKSLAGNVKPRYYFFLGNDVTTFHRGHSSAGRAPAWHAGGQRFDPAWLHQIRTLGRLDCRQFDEYNASPSSRGLGHHPFTVATGVRIPVGTPFIRYKRTQPYRVFFYRSNLPKRLHGRRKSFQFDKKPLS